MKSTETYQKKFRVFSISKNTNSFGLYGVIVIAIDGEAHELGISYLFLPEKGNEITATVRHTHTDTYIANGEPIINRSITFNIAHEIPRRLQNCPEHALVKIFSEKV